MTLKEVFRKRAARANSTLENPEAGPRRICFSSNDLVAEKLKTLHKKFPGEKKGVIYLYQLSFESNENVSISQTREAFREVRAKKNFNMSRDNMKHPETSSLYVGTSKNLYERFRTHLGRGTGTATWALYLSSWGIAFNAKFFVEYYEFTDTVAEDVELIEGVLWDSLLPLFGKKGGK